MVVAEVLIVEEVVGSQGTLKPKLLAVPDSKTILTGSDKIVVSGVQSGGVSAPKSTVTSMLPFEGVRPFDAFYCIEVFVKMHHVKSRSHESPRFEKDGGVQD